MYDIQHCFICRPSDSTVSEDTGNEPRTVAATTALAVRRSNHAARSHPHSARSHRQSTANAMASHMYLFRKGRKTPPAINSHDVDRRYV
jgi:hypothetical protein